MKNEEVKLEKNKKKWTKSDIKKFIINNKKTFIVSISAFVIVVAVIVGMVALFGNSYSLSNTKDHLSKRLNELAKEFYEVKYYPNLTNSKTGKVMSDEEKKQFAARYKDTGITIDLESLARLYGDKKEEILNEFKNGDKACNYANTKIVIYPKDPYEKKSYESKVILDCGFDEK